MFGASLQRLMIVWLSMAYLMLNTATLQTNAAPVPSVPQHGIAVTSPPDRSVSSRDHQSSDNSQTDHASSDSSPPDHQPTDSHSQNQQSDHHKEDDCHFKNTEIALPITFSLEMPSYVMIAGHRFHIKLQMPVVNHGK